MDAIKAHLLKSQTLGFTASAINFLFASAYLQITWQGLH
jgi:hypothetical protein